MAAIEGAADADPAARSLALHLDELQLDLRLVGIGVASPGGLEDGARITTLGHEHLGGVVDLGELRMPRVSNVDLVDHVRAERDHTSPPMTARTPLGSWLMTPLMRVKS
mgnify:CR=1 FL=1